MVYILISDVVEVLVQSTVLLENIWRFATSINVSADLETELKQRLGSRVIKYFECLSEILKAWVEKQSTSATVASLERILQRMDCYDVAEVLCTRFQGDDVISARILPETSFKATAISGLLSMHKTIGPAKIFYNCGEPYNSFSGREEELNRLRNEMKNLSGPRLILITGLAGLGKTELTRKFCKEMYDNGTTCLWFLAENAITLKTDIEKMARKIGINPRENANCNEIFSEIMEGWSDCKVIVVFDNLDLKYSEVDSILEETLENGKPLLFIITSRNVTMLQEYSPTLLEVETFSVETAIFYVERELELDFDAQISEEVRELCEQIQCYTLALRQAVAYIKRERLIGIKGKSFRVSNYLEKLRSNEKSNLLGMTDFDHKYKKTTLTTMCVTLDYIATLPNGVLTIALLRLVSYISPDNISMKELKKLYIFFIKRLGICSDEDSLESCVLNLKSYNLVKCEDSVLSVHRMVQEVARHIYKGQFWSDINALFNQDYFDEVLTINLFSDVSETVLHEYNEEEFSDFLKNNWNIYFSTFRQFIVRSNGFSELFGFLTKVKNIFGSICHPGIVKLFYYSLPKKFKVDFFSLSEKFWKECFLSDDTFDLRVFPESDPVFISFIGAKMVASDSSKVKKYRKKKDTYRKVSFLDNGFRYCTTFNNDKHGIHWYTQFKYFDEIAEQLGDWCWEMQDWNNCFLWRERRYKFVKLESLLFENNNLLDIPLKQFLSALIKLGKSDDAFRIFHEEKKVWEKFCSWDLLWVLLSLSKAVNLEREIVFWDINLLDVLKSGINQIRACRLNPDADVDYLTKINHLLCFSFTRFSVLLQQDINLLQNLVCEVEIEIHRNEGMQMVELRGNNVLRKLKAISISS